MGRQVPLLVDVDTGIDDALALALATRSPETRILGVTTVAGNVPVELATDNTLRVLSWCGAADIPVFRGASRPLAAGFQDAAHVHGANGLGGAELPGPTRNVEELSAPQAIIQLAEAYAGELVVVALGPLTNIAIALNLQPELTTKVSSLVVMGGAFDVPGNVTSAAEFNIYADPHAAAHVLAAPWSSIVAVGLDVTHQTALSRASWARIAEDAQGTEGLTRRILARTFTERGMSGLYLHDPLALAVALDPSLISTEPCHVRVTFDGAERGQTRAENGGAVDVARRVRAAEFVQRVAQRLGLPPVELSGALRSAE
ncbi:MAG: nucleoside hydrolase [Chloroflexia bacterium]|nr:nucleoside hydrolase [Chloroflexia bacterium]